MCYTFDIIKKYAMLTAFSISTGNPKFVRRIVTEMSWLSATTAEEFTGG